MVSDNVFLIDAKCSVLFADVPDPPTALFDDLLHESIPAAERAFAAAMHFGRAETCMVRATWADGLMFSLRFDPVNVSGAAYCIVRVARLPAAIAKLSQRETEVLRLTQSAVTTKAAANALGISPSTVDSHRAHLRQKLGVADMIQLALVAERFFDGGQEQ